MEWKGLYSAGHPAAGLSDGVISAQSWSVPACVGKDCSSFHLPWRISLVAERARLEIDCSESGWDLWAP